MENLNKENFFNNLQTFYPQAMKEFCDWIDAYKVEVQWEHLFQMKAIRKPGVLIPQGTVKFHDIPFEMQLGILGRFLCEKNGCPDPNHVHIREEVRADLTNYFLEREKTLTHG